MRTGQPGLAGAPLNFGMVLAAHLVILTVVGVTTSKLDLQVSESKPILASIIAPSRPSPVVVPAPTPPKPVVKETPKKILTAPPAPTPTPVAPASEPVKKVEPSPVVEQKTDTKTKASQEAAASEVIQPKFDADYLNNPKPGYPSISRRLGEEGVVMLRVYVSAQGTPEQIHELEHAWADAAERTPHGQPIELDAHVTGAHLRTAPACGASPPAATPTTEAR